MDSANEQQEGTLTYNPIILVLQFFANYGWYLVGVGAAFLYVANKLRPKFEQWKQAREDAEYHKDPDKVLSRMEAIQQAREKQQRLLEVASSRALEAQREKEEKKKAEIAEKLKKLHENGGQTLGSAADDGYLPLSGGASTSSYRPPKRSACSKGGCGR